MVEVLVMVDNGHDDKCGGSGSGDDDNGSDDGGHDAAGDDGDYHAWVLKRVCFEKHKGPDEEANICTCKKVKRWGPW